MIGATGRLISSTSFGRASGMLSLDQVLSVCVGFLFFSLEMLFTER